MQFTISQVTSTDQNGTQTVETLQKKIHVSTGKSSSQYKYSLIYKQDVNFSPFELIQLSDALACKDGPNEE